MTQKTDISLKIEGFVTTFIRKDGIDVPVDGRHNAPQAYAADVVCEALMHGKPLSKVYFLYANTSSPSAIGASAKNLTIQDFLTIGASSGHGLVSSPVFATGKAAGQGTTILPMTADFLSVTSPANHLKGISFSNGVYVYAVGLVQTTDTGDSLYAACDVSPIAKTANSQVGVRWQTTITIS
jgi:hypothetical protein